MRKKILIISYTFPPYPGIGGRRWAKFAKYLAGKGYKAHVICCENVFEEQSLWNKDVLHENITVHALPVKYPTVVLHGASSFLDKLKYRFWKFYFFVYSKGVFFDRAIFWKKQLLKKASSVISKEGITNVIVSIPPYRLARYAIDLKNANPFISLVVDYRDPWTDNKSFHGFKDLKPERLEYERQLEDEVLNKADHVITVSDKMTEMLKQKIKNLGKIITIPNGFDPEDIVKTENEVYKTSGDKIRFVYAGTLYSNLEYIIDPLIEYLEKLKSTQAGLYKRISFEFYGNHNAELVNKMKNAHNESIAVYPPLTLEDMQSVLRACSFCVLMSAPDHSFAFNTKFYEYLANRKPILLFSYPGETSDFLLKNKLGFTVDPSSIAKEMDAFFAEIPAIISSYNTQFNIDSFSLPSLTNEIEKLLI